MIELTFFLLDNVGETISTVEKITVKENNENEASVKSMDEKAVIDTLNLEKVNSADKSESIYKEQNKIMPSSPNQNSNFLKKYVIFLLKILSTNILLICIGDTDLYT